MVQHPDLDKVGLKMGVPVMTIVSARGTEAVITRFLDELKTDAELGNQTITTFVTDGAHV